MSCLGVTLSEPDVTYVSYKRQRTGEGCRETDAVEVSLACQCLKEDVQSALLASRVKDSCK